MAAKSQFWVEKVTRKYNGEVRSVWRAIWIDQIGTERSKENKKWRKADAEQYAADMAAQVRGGVFVPDRNKATMADAIQIWLANLEDRNRSPREICGAYLKNMQRLARLTLMPEFGNLRPFEVDQRFVEKWARRMMVEKHMSAYRVDYTVKRLRLLLDVAKEHDWIAINPLRQIKAKLPEVQAAKIEVPEDADIVAMLQSLEHCPVGDVETLFSSMRMLIFLVAYAGLRPNEACALHWEDIDFDRWEIYVHRGLTVEEGHKAAVKTRSGERHIDILEMLAYELQDYRQRLTEITPKSGRLKSWNRLAELNANPTGLVIRNTNIDTLMPQLAGIHWRKLRSRVTDRDLTKFSLYSLRHYAGSIWLRDGVSLPRVSKMMGHADIATTERVYIKILRELDETRFREMKQVSDRLGERYRHLGLELASRPTPMLTAPPVVLLPANGAPKQEIVAVPVAEADQEIVAAPVTVADLRAMQHREVLKLYDAGMAPDRIARKIKIAPSTVRNWLDDRHIEVVYRNKHDMDPATREKRDAEARRLAEEDGLDYREIAERLGMQVQTLRAVAYRQGWKAPKKVKRYIPRGPKQTVEERRVYQHQYDASEARRESRKRYWANEKGQEARIRANESRLEKRHLAAEAAGITIQPRRSFSTDEERKAASREAQHRYKTSEVGRTKGREDRRKHWERKREAAQPEEIVCECGRTFMRTYRPGRPRTKCEECSPPDQRPPRTEYHRELKRRLRERKAAESAQIGD